MDGFDSKTVILIMSIGQVLSILIFSYYLLNYRHEDSNLKAYVLGRILQFFGPFLSLVFADHLTPTMMTLTILLFYPGIAIETYCLVNHENSKDKRKLYQLLLLSFIAIIIYAFVASNLTLRVIVTSAYYAFLFFYIFSKSVFPKINSSIYKLIGWISFFALSVNLIRLYFSAFAKTQLPIYSEALPQILFLLVFVITTFSFPLLFLLILQEKNMQEIQKLSATKDKFFKIIGHDLKAPIWQMMQFSELIEARYDELNKDHLLALVKDLKETSTNGFNLLENLLNWAMANTSKLKYKPELTNFEELIKENVELIKKQADQKDISIKLRDSYEGELRIDKNMINTVIRNLLSNAIKFTHLMGCIEIKSYLENDKLFFSIKDNGTGISKEHGEHLFHIDNKFSSKGTNNEKGTGIGLMLCKEFIDKHKGEIWVESEVGKGSCFTFCLPLEV